jgi:hypothetical protein
MVGPVKANGAVARTWGPFSGRQLTTIICIGLVTILFPVGAWAVSGTNSFITDSTSGVRAKITSTGELQTHPNGPLGVTGSVSVSGAVRTANPVDMYTTVFGLSDSTPAKQCAILTPPAGHALVITSLKLSLSASNTFPFSVNFYRGSGTCAAPTFLAAKDSTTFNQPGSFETEFPTGLVIPSGNVLIIQGALQTANAVTIVTVNGFQMPNSACSTIAACSLGG